MGKTRDRVASGKLAAVTNRKKDPDYYEKAGSLGGSMVAAAKRAFSSIPGLARRAVTTRFSAIDEFRTEYILRTVPDGHFIGTFNRREAARVAQRIHRIDKGTRSKITQYKYHTNRFEGGFIVSDRLRHEELDRLAALDEQTQATAQAIAGNELAVLRRDIR